MDGRNLRPFVLLSIAVHVLLCFLYVNAVRARVPVPRPPVYRVSIVELQPEKKAVPVPEAPKKEVKLPEPEPEKLPEPEVQMVPEPEPEKIPERIPEKPRPKKKEPEKKPEPEKEEKKAEPMKETVKAETPKGVTSSTGAVTVEAEDFPFAYYLALIEARIGGRWMPPRGLVGGGRMPKATVRFEIERSGSVRSAHLSVSSGVPFFDQSALRAVNECNPFPPLPEGFPGERLGVNFVFTFGG
ncbi:MAG: energy transducer TonB [Candidatus Eisenbacteria bacterium]